MSELTSLSAVAMAEQVRKKKISPVELVDAHLARIAQLHPRLNAFVALDEERARRDARTLEAAAVRGEVRGALHGVPISIKSSIDTAGRPC
jgi:Asp-tRNA(Asn)/Glu-tRNA(Gln) amidotransferase A subunit family amidase